MSNFSRTHRDSPATRFKSPELAPSAIAKANRCGQDRDSSAPTPRRLVRWHESMRTSGKWLYEHLSDRLGAGVVCAKLRAATDELPTNMRGPEQVSGRRRPARCDGDAVQRAL